MKFTFTLLFTILFYVAFSQNSTQNIADSLEQVRKQELLKIADPTTGTIPYEELEKAREEIAKRTTGKQLNVAISPALTWYERGPKDMGGNVRCITQDPNDLSGKKYWAGTENGGLWYNNDLTSANSTWNQVVGGDNWSSINISSIAFNPSNPLEMYVSTGDYNDFGSGVGSGIYKSTDGGTTFTRLSSTIPNSSIIGSIPYAFQYITKIVINSSGQIFVNTWRGLLKSIDGGANWTYLLNSQVGSDLDIGNDGIIYVAFGFGYNDTRIYRSTDNTGNSWTDISPSSIGSRTIIALANSQNQSSQVIYAFAVDGPVKWFKKSINGGTSWTDLPIPQNPYNSGDFLGYTAGAASMKVHPSNPDVVFAGGGSLTKSINGGATWTTSFSSNGMNGMTIGSNGNSFAICSGNGVYISSDFGNQTNTLPIFSVRSLGFRIQKGVSVTMNNIAENGVILIAGAKVSSALHTVGGSSSGAGGGSSFVFIDQDDPNIVIADGNLYNSNLGYITNLRVNYSNYYDYDSQNNVYYSYYTNNSTSSTFERTIGVGTTNIKSTFSVNAQIYPSFLKAGKTANTIFVGAEQGKLFKITNIDTSPIVTRIDNNQLPTPNTNLSSIDIGIDDNEILITYSNFGINSVWYTNNGGATWVNKDAAGYGLPNIPVRYGRLVRLDPSGTPKVVLATELGVFTTNNIQDANPAWEVSNTGLPNVRCNWIYYRSIDSVLAVSTQGRGVFTSPMRGFANPSINNDFNKGVLCKSGSASIPFSTFGTFPSGMVFNVEISNSTGSFASPTVIGSGTNSPISVTLPSNLTSSSNYKIRIVSVEVTPKFSNESPTFSVRSTSEISFSTSNYDNVSPINGAYNFCEGSNISVVFFTSFAGNISLLPYSWTGPNGFTSNSQALTINNASASAAGIYTVSSTIESCQTYTSTVQLALTTTPTVNSYASPSIICPNTTAYLYVFPKVFSSGNVSYQWSGPNNFSSTVQNPNIPNVSANAAGVYTVTSVFSGSCNSVVTSTASLTISNNLPISTNVSGQTCGGGTVALVTFINASTSGMTLSYSWSGPNSFTSSLQNPTISNLSSTNAGIYTVTVTYSGSCAGTSTSTVNVALNNPSINIGGTNPFCNGSVVNLSATMSLSGLTTQYSWAGPNNFTSTSSTLTIPSLTSTSAGSYTVTASYTGACAGIVTRIINVNLNNVFVSYSGSTRYCIGVTTNLSASVTTSGLSTQYSWAGPNGFTSAGNVLAISNFTSTNVGSYTVTASYTGACNGTATTSITLNVSNPFTLSSTGNEYCPGASGIISVNISTFSNPTSYSWVGPNGFTSSVANPTITNIDASKAGTYTMTVIFGDGCNVTSTATTAIILTTAIPPYYISKNIIGGEYCLNNGSASLNVTSNNNFSSSNISSVSWVGPNSFSSSSVSLNLPLSSINNSGVYTATISFIGCVGTATATTNINISSEPKVNASVLSNTIDGVLNSRIQIYKSVDACVGNYFRIEASANSNNATYAWSGPNGFTGTFNSLFISNVSASMAGVYTVTATITGACAGTVTSTVQLNFINSTPPNITITPENFVVGQPVTLSAANCAGTLKWDYNAATSNPLVFMPTDGQSIFATCTTNGCITANSRRVTFHDCVSSYQLGLNLSNLITRYEASDNITATNKLFPVSNITYDAQNSVILNPGFEVQAGSVFKAQIDGCGNN